MGAASRQVRQRCCGLIQEHQDEAQLWRRMASLEASDPLPVEMPHLLYTRLGSLMRFCDYPERLAPFFQHFPAEKQATMPSRAGAQS